jgi:transcription initiation factor TFIIF subunit alpha
MGTNTPSGRPKHTDPLRKSTNGLKRSGSPNLSESSGNESSRKKKQKKKHSSTQPSGSSTPIPGSRPMSPSPSSQPAAGKKSSMVKLTVNPNKVSDIQSTPPNPSPTYSGAMSDAEATGGEMPDAGKRKKKIKLRLGGTPSGSRAGSPEVRNGTGSRATSPQAPGKISLFICSFPFSCSQYLARAGLVDAQITIFDKMKFHVVFVERRHYRGFHSCIFCSQVTIEN